MSNALDSSIFLPRIHVAGVGLSSRQKNKPLIYDSLRISWGLQVTDFSLLNGDELLAKYDAKGVSTNILRNNPSCLYGEKITL